MTAADAGLRRAEEETMTVPELVAELHDLREKVRRGPSEKATEAQHAKGKLTA
ncbi:acetyl-CoA carboxylase carboxyltransferase component, partial [Kitasatospora sp. GP82]|nr:acetyl-CoA carboxylase carboxyltransferase component [Kitasatospora sp. GP82]